MEIKVQCDCGQKFKFDAEPVDDKMPWEVNCPVCGLSGTGKANAIIAQQLSAAPPPPPPPSEPVPPAAPYKARLTISRPAAAPASI